MATENDNYITQDISALTLQDLLTTVTPETCTQTWVSCIRDIAEEKTDIWNTLVGGPKILPAFIFQLGNLACECNAHIRENVREVLAIICTESNVKHIQLRICDIIVLVEHGDPNEEGQMLYIDTLAALCSCVQRTCHEAGDILAKVVVVLLIQVDLFKRYPQFWHLAIQCCVDHGALPTNQGKNGRVFLMDMLLSRIKTFDLSEESSRDVYLKVVKLLAMLNLAHGKIEDVFPTSTLASNASDILKKEGCVEIVSGVLDALLSVCPENIRQRKISEFLQLMIDGKGISGRITPCNAAWVDMIQIAIERGADLMHRCDEKRSLLHHLVRIPALIQNPDDEMVTNFMKALRLLSNRQTVRAVSIAGYTALDSLKTQVALGNTVQHWDIYSQAKDILLESMELENYWAANLYHTVSSTDQYMFKERCTIAWAESVKDAAYECKKRKQSMLWKDKVNKDMTALHWIIAWFYQLMPFPSEDVIKSYMKVLDNLAVPELMVAFDRDGNTPLESVVQKATDILVSVDGVDFYVEVVKVMIDGYSTLKDGFNLLGKALGCLIDNYKLVTTSAVQMYFKLFDKFLAAGAKLPQQTLVKYFQSCHNEDSLKFNKMAVTHPKMYVLIVKKLLEAMDANKWRSGMKTLFDKPLSDVEHAIVLNEKLEGMKDHANLCQAKKDENSKHSVQESILNHVKNEEKCTVDSHGRHKPLSAITWGFNKIMDVFILPKQTAKLISQIHDLMLSNEVGCDDFVFQLKKAIKDKTFEKCPQILSNTVPSNGMKRKALHLLAMICDENEIFEALAIYCSAILSEQIHMKDLHGCTPYMIAVFHKNGAAADFFVKHGADNKCLDNYLCHPNELLHRNVVSWNPAMKCLQVKEKNMTNYCDVVYFNENLAFANALEAKDSQSKNYLPTHPKDEHEVQSVMEEYFKRMADFLVKKHPWLECKLRMAGSIGERTKIGRTDEYDVQFIFTAISKEVDVLHIANSKVGNVHLRSEKFIKSLPQDLCFENGNLNVHLFGQILHQELINSLSSREVSELPIRAVKMSNPWLLVWEKTGLKKGLQISIDIVPIILIDEKVVKESLGHSKGTPEEYNPEALKIKQGNIVSNPRCRPLKLFLRWGRPGREHRLVPTIADYERDLIDSMPLQIRNGIKIVKSLLEIAYWKEGAYYADVDKPITSYMVKNSAFWIVCEEIHARTLTSTTDTLEELAEAMTRVKMTLYHHHLEEGIGKGISDNLLDSFPKSDDLVQRGSPEKGMLDYNYAVNDSMRKSVAGSSAFFKMIFSHAVKMGEITTDARSQPQYEKHSHDVGIKSARMVKLFAPDVTDDCFYSQNFSELLSSTKNDVEKRRLEEYDDELVGNNSISQKKNQTLSVGSVYQSNHDMTQSNMNSTNESLNDANKTSISWAIKILTFIKQETLKRYGLPIYYSSEEKPDYLIEKWNKHSIGKMCDQLLDWLDIKSKGLKE